MKPKKKRWQIARFDSEIQHGKTAGAFITTTWMAEARGGPTTVVGSSVGRALLWHCWILSELLQFLPGVVVR